MPLIVKRDDHKIAGEVSVRCFKVRERGAGIFLRLEGSEVRGDRIHEFVCHGKP
jgi:hypothetical protein